jgi:hypothetical protein
MKTNKPELRAFILRQGWEPAEYIDKLSRQGRQFAARHLTRLLADAQNKRFDVVVVHRGRRPQYAGTPVWTFVGEVS